MTVVCGLATSVLHTEHHCIHGIDANRRPRDKLHLHRLIELLHVSSDPNAQNDLLRKRGQPSSTPAPIPFVRISGGKRLFVGTVMAASNHS